MVIKWLCDINSQQELNHGSLPEIVPFLTLIWNREMFEIMGKNFETQTSGSPVHV